MSSVNFKCSIQKLEQFEPCKGSINKLVNLNYQIPVFGTSISIQSAIKGRANLFDEDDNLLYVCEFHENSLGRNHSDNRITVCKLPIEFSGHSSGQRKAARSLSYEQSAIMQASHEILLEPGKPICYSCRKKVMKTCKKYVDDKLIETKLQADKKLAEVRVNREEECGYMLRPVHQNSQSSDVFSSNSQVSEKSEGAIDSAGSCMLSQPDSQQKEIEADYHLRKYFECIEQPLFIGKKCMDDLHPKRKAERKAEAKIAITSVLKTLYGDDATTIWKELVETERQASLNKKAEANVFKSLAEAYCIAKSWHDKRSILSIVASQVGYDECEKFFNGLTKKAYQKARRHGFYIGIGKNVEKEKGKVKFSESAVDHFLSFVTSSYIQTDLPFGLRSLRLSNGELLEVPNMIRNMIPERIVEQYHAFCEQEKLERNYSENFKPLQRSSLLMILDCCKASVRKSLQGLDYFTTAGCDAFDSVKKVVEVLEERRCGSNEWRMETLKELKLAKEYMKNSFRSHISRKSENSSHCIQFALNDPTAKPYKEKCAHKHVTSCNDCSKVSQLVDSVKQIVQDSELNETEKMNFIYQLDSAETDIDQWKSHQLRVVNQDQSRKDVSTSLIPGKTVFCTMDWAMKFLPTQYREDQTSFFGKRGLPWHISVVLRKNENGEFESRTLVHVFDQCKQDSAAVLAIIQDVLTKLKQEMPELDEISLRSDNAGCYHSSEIVHGCAKMFEATGVRVRRFDYSDPQGGKSDADRAAAVIKRHIRQYVSEKHNCTTPEEFVEAVNSYSGICGTTVHCGIITDNQFEKCKKKALGGISTLNNFLFNYDSTVRVWRAYQIGEGQLMSVDSDEQSSNDTLPTFKEVRNANELTNVPTLCEWRQLGSKTVKAKSTTNSKDFTDCPQQEVEQKNLFMCPEEACTKDYRFLSHLELHMRTGNHKYIEHCQTLADTSMKLYKAKVDDLQLSSKPVIEAKDTLPKNNDCPIEGWALQKRKKTGKFSDKQRTFLLEKYIIGEESGHKLTADHVANMMMVEVCDGEKLFSANEYLSRQQIMSYWSRLTNNKAMCVAGFEEEDIKDIIEMEQRESNILETIEEVQIKARELLSDGFDNDKELSNSSAKKIESSTSLERINQVHQEATSKDKNSQSAEKTGKRSIFSQVKNAFGFERKESTVQDDKRKRAQKRADYLYTKRKNLPKNASTENENKPKTHFSNFATLDESEILSDPISQRKRMQAIRESKQSYFESNFLAPEKEEIESHDIEMEYFSSNDLETKKTSTKKSTETYDSVFESEVVEDVSSMMSKKTSRERAKLGAMSWSTFTVSKLPSVPTNEPGHSSVHSSTWSALFPQVVTHEPGATTSGPIRMTLKKMKQELLAD